MPRLNLNMYDIVTEDEPAVETRTETLTEESPAMDLFNRALGNTPLQISSDMPALEAIKLLANSAGKLHFVVNLHHRFQGIIELENLNAIEFIKRTANGYTREELLVSDFMIPRRVLRAFDIEELKAAQIRDIIDSLAVTGADYCLAVDRESHRIRGLLAREEIEDCLGIKIKSIQPSITQMVANLHS